MKHWSTFILFIFVLTVANGCYEEDKLDVPQKTQPVSDDEIDQYIQANFVDRYGIAVRYKYVDRYVDQTKRVTPPSREVVEPMMDFLTEFWVDPFVAVPNGAPFFREHVPAEIVLIGSPMFNEDGTVTLGTADAGARITLTEVNNLDLTSEEWVFQQIHVIYHEFAHIVHQRYNLPPNWQQISPEGYTSAGSWYNLSDEEALERGFVSPYATTSFNEDFAETVSFILYNPDFYTRYMDDETDCADVACITRNEGRVKIRAKYASVLNHYLAVVGVDLLQVRDIIQAKLP